RCDVGYTQPGAPRGGSRRAVSASLALSRSLRITVENPASTVGREQPGDTSFLALVLVVPRTDEQCLPVKVRVPVQEALNVADKAHAITTQIVEAGLVLETTGEDTEIALYVGELHEVRPEIASPPAPFRLSRE